MPVIPPRNRQAPSSAQEPGANRAGGKEESSRLRTVAQSQPDKKGASLCPRAISMGWTGCYGGLVETRLCQAVPMHRCANSGTLLLDL